MRLWHFTVTIKDLPEFSDELVDRLYEAGCDDGTLGSSKGRSHIGFSRESATLEEAICSAIANVQACGITVERVEMEANDLAAVGS